MDDDGYRFELVDPRNPDQIARISGLLRQVFPNAWHLTPQYLAWQYRDNPDGEAVGCNAWHEGELVGHMAAYAMVGRLNGEEKRGQFMLNGAVAAAHRRKRLQSRISKVIFDESVRRGFAFCFGTGNRWSTVPLLTRFQMVRPLHARVGVGRPVRRAHSPSPSFERVWSDAALRWRLANPSRSYSVQRRDGFSTVLAGTGIPFISTILYEELVEEVAAATAKAAGPLRLWLGLDPAIDWSRSAFLPIPQRLRPSPLNLVFRDLTGAGSLPDPTRVVFRSIDFDAY